MEKRSAHYPLSEVKALIALDRVNATGTAFKGAREIGINNLAGMCQVIMALSNANLLKSMTSFADHTIWQDVYHAKAPNGSDVYLKLSIIDDVLIVSFKEL